MGVFHEEAFPKLQSTNGKIIICNLRDLQFGDWWKNFVHSIEQI